jgi:hypothetical protein
MNPDNAERVQAPEAGRWDGTAAQDPFGREAGAVLAVLLLAAYWPGRFPDRWVSSDDIGSNSRDLPKPRKKEETRRGSLKTLVRKGLRELAPLLPADTVERKPVGGVATARDPREVSTRLRSSPSPALDGWFARFGLDRLDLDTRRDFREHSYGALGSMADFVTGIEEGIIHRLLEHGQRTTAEEAAALATRALANAATHHERRVFVFALARAELGQGSPDETALAYTRLRKLAEDPGPFRSPAEQLLQARILIQCARASALAARGISHFDIAEARPYLDRARELISPENHLDRGDLLLKEAEFEGLEAWRCIAEHLAPDEVMRHEAKAELSFLLAINAYRLVQQWDRIRYALRQLWVLARGLRLRTLDKDRGHLLIPWLNALLRLEAVPQRPQRTRPGPDLYERELLKESLEAFNALPLDLSEADVPLPAQEGYELVKRCIDLYRIRGMGYDSRPGDPERDERALPVEGAAWFRAMQEEEKTRRGD